MKLIKTISLSLVLVLATLIVANLHNLARADFVPTAPPLNTDSCGTPELKAICGNANPTEALISQVVLWVLSLTGILIIIVIIISGIQMSSSAGNPDALKKAKNHLLAAIVSLALLVSMTAILQLIGFTII